jgi:thioredoxin 1
VIAPVVEELAGTYQGKMKMGKLNVDDHPQVAARFRIMNIPTLLLFKGGKEVDRIVGVVPKEELTRRIERAIG